MSKDKNKPGPRPLSVDDAVARRPPMEGQVQRLRELKAEWERKGYDHELQIIVINSMVHTSPELVESNAQQVVYHQLEAENAYAVAEELGRQLEKYEALRPRPGQRLVPEGTFNG